MMEKEKKEQIWKMINKGEDFTSVFEKEGVEGRDTYRALCYIAERMAEDIKVSNNKSTEYYLAMIITFLYDACETNMQTKNFIATLCVEDNDNDIMRLLKEKEEKEIDLDLFWLKAYNLFTSLDKDIQEKTKREVCAHFRLEDIMGNIVLHPERK